MVDARGTVGDVAVRDAEVEGELVGGALHAVAQADGPDARGPVHGAAVDRHRVRVVQEPDVGAELLHLGAHVEHHRDRPEAAHDPADPERVGDGLAQAELLRDFEVGDGRGLVATDLDHVDRVVSAVERGPPVGGRDDLRLRVECICDAAGDERGGLEPFGVDVEQRDLGVGELLVPEDVTEQVAREHSAARADEHDLGHARNLPARGGLNPCGGCGSAARGRGTRTPRTRARRALRRPRRTRRAPRQSPGPRQS